MLPVSVDVGVIAGLGHDLRAVIVDLGSGDGHAHAEVPLEKVLQLADEILLRVHHELARLAPRRFAPAGLRDFHVGLLDALPVGHDDEFAAAPQAYSGQRERRGVPAELEADAHLGRDFGGAGKHARHQHPFGPGLHRFREPHVVPIVWALPGHIHIDRTGGIGFDPERERVGAGRFNAHIRQLEFLPVQLRGGFRDFEPQGREARLRPGLVEHGLDGELRALVQPPATEVLPPFRGLKDIGPGRIERRAPGPL